MQASACEEEESLTWRYTTPHEPTATPRAARRGQVWVGEGGGVQEESGLVVRCLGGRIQGREGGGGEWGEWVGMAM